MKNDKGWMKNDEGWWFQAVEGFCRQTDGMTDEQTFVIWSNISLKMNMNDTKERFKAWEQYWWPKLSPNSSKKWSSNLIIYSTRLYPEGDDTIFRFWFSVCHVTSLLSALVNPILYGYFNKVSETYSVQTKIIMKQVYLFQQIDFIIRDSGESFITYIAVSEMKNYL